jgi:hypothetical protein
MEFVLPLRVWALMSIMAGLSVVLDRTSATGSSGTPLQDVQTQ